MVRVPVRQETARGAFTGMTVRDTYTKAAHSVLLKEMLPLGKIVLTTEQEPTLPGSWRGGKQTEQQAPVASHTGSDPKPVEDDSFAQAGTMDRVE